MQNGVIEACSAVQLQRSVPNSIFTIPVSHDRCDQRFRRGLFSPVYISNGSHWCEPKSCAEGAVFQPRFNMKFLPITPLAHLGVAWAAALSPQLENRQAYVPCNSTLYNVPVCCEQNIIGQDINCVVASPPPTLGPSEYQQECWSIGKYARCCLEPPIGNLILCTHPVGFPPGEWDSPGG
ncbi:hypothetical protein F4777DRAFT_71395 [Nemania sp. FL0916]|nr:hypothetical protein F4777DRAFT_71395 [Nemania sp. FL0916]